MRPEKSEILFVEDLFNQSLKKKKIPAQDILTVEKLTGDASTRRYYRLNTDSNRYVVCLDEPRNGPPQDYPFFCVGTYLEQNKIRVPKIYDLDLSKGFVLEEDLGDETLLKRLGEISNLGEEYALYEKCLDILLNILNLDTNDSTRVVRNLHFDIEKYSFELKFTKTYFLEGLLKAKLSPGEIEVLSKFHANLSQALTQFPVSFCHRDFHSRNIMIKDSDLVLIDFQDARMGLPQYDLVSLLEDCYYSVSSENRGKLKKYFYDNLPQKNKESWEQFCHVYDLVKIQRIYKAMGSFSYIYQTRGDARYLKYIGQSFERLREVLFKHSQYKDFLKLICHHYYGS